MSCPRRAGGSPGGLGAIAHLDRLGPSPQPVAPRVGLWLRRVAASFTSIAPPRGAPLALRSGSFANQYKLCIHNLEGTQISMSCIRTTDFSDKQVPRCPGAHRQSRENTKTHGRLGRGDTCAVAALLLKQGPHMDSVYKSQVIGSLQRKQITLA